MSICSPFGTNYFFILMACFYSYSSFMILLPHVVFENLKEFQIRAKKITTSLYILSSHCRTAKTDLLRISIGSKAPRDRVSH